MNSSHPSMAMVSIQQQIRYLIIVTSESGGQYECCSNACVALLFLQQSRQ